MGILIADFLVPVEAIVRLYHVVLKARVIWATPALLYEQNENIHVNNVYFSSTTTQSLSFDCELLYMACLDYSLLKHAITNNTRQGDCIRIF